MFPPWRLPNLTPDIIHINVLAAVSAKWCGRQAVSAQVGGSAHAGRQDLMAADGPARSRRKPIVTSVPIRLPESVRAPFAPAAKPTPAGLGVDLASLDWQRSGSGPGSFEVAFIAASRGKRAGQVGQEVKADWVLLRISDDPAGRVLVYDRNEWTCFLDGAGHGEFDGPEALRHVSRA
jgi:hypothetical protein